MTKSDEKQSTVYRFGRFEVNAREQLLRRDGEIVPLSTKIFETLLLLVRNNNRMLSKDEIMETVWSDSFVEETNLTSNISRLRKILHAEGEQFIETFPKRGYRFLGDVKEITPETEIILTRRVRMQIRQVVEETNEAETAESVRLNYLLATVPNNLPAAQTPLVGREKEIAEIESLLEKAGLVTLTGVGGTGKTRLAREIARRMLEEFTDGVFFIALADVQNPEFVVPAIAQPFGVKETGNQSLIETLKNFLNDKHLLLVIDNFEQVVSAAPILNEILEAAPQLKILATSRALLKLQPEREFIVPPLDFPADFSASTSEKLAESESVKLFIARAQAAKSNFVFNGENAPTVAEICARLEGLPLAIELAAARIKILSPQQISARLESRLKLLTGGARDLPTRQQTMRGAIEWSYDLLDKTERVLFERLAVFAAGFTVEAAEAICNNYESNKDQRPKTKNQKPPLDVLNGITSLIENSLLVQAEMANGESRFRLLEVVREYALEKLVNDGELEEMRRSHAEFFLDLAMTAAPHLVGADQMKWFSILESEHDNLRAAYAWSSETNAEKALQMARALWQFWLVRGHLTEGGANMREALRRTTDLLIPLRGEALVGAGFLERMRGNLEKAREYGNEALTLGRKIGDTNIIVTALNGLGIVAGAQNDEAESRAFLEEGLQVCQATENKRYIGLFLNNLGENARRRGDYAEARRLYLDSLAIQRERGNTRIVAIALGNLGRVSFLQNDFDAAREFFIESLEINRSLGDLHSIALLLDGFAGLAADAHPELAAELLGAANALRQTIGSDFDKADAEFYEKIYQTVESNLEKEKLAKHLNIGGALKLEQAVSLALDV
jgi:predicted ATPase/DNA-binding winged helix-turn-helix (wHTH) protein